MISDFLFQIRKGNLNCGIVHGPNSSIHLASILKQTHFRCWENYHPGGQNSMAGVTFSRPLVGDLMFKFDFVNIYRWKMTQESISTGSLYNVTRIDNRLGSLLLTAYQMTSSKCIIVIKRITITINNALKCTFKCTICCHVEQFYIQNVISVSVGIVCKRILLVICSWCYRLL